MSSNLKEQILRGINLAADNPAFISENENLSYNQLLRNARSLTELLRYSGINKSSFLCLEVTKNIDFLIALLAAVLTEVVLIPFATNIKKEEREHLLSVTCPEYTLTKINGQWVINKTSLAVHKEVRSIVPNGGFIRPTSGTTSTSKGVLISSESALERINACTAAFDINKGDSVLCLMSYPFHFIASLLSFLSSGATIITPNNFNEDAIKSSCWHKAPTIIYGSPHHFELLNKMDLLNELKDIKLPISTGTKLPKQTRDEFFRNYRTSIVEIFGIIEVGLALKSTSNSSGLTAIPPIDHSINTDGQLLLKGPGMLDAYLSPFKPRATILEDSWFNTSDIAEINSENSINILGRSTTAIHVGAHKVFPEEIEEQIKQLDGVSAVKVYGVPHNLFGREIRAKITTRKTLDEKEIISYLRKTLGSLKCPKKIDFVDSIELTKSGKIKRS